jgi:hypothetical protein
MIMARFYRFSDTPVTATYGPPVAVKLGVWLAVLGTVVILVIIGFVFIMSLAMSGEVGL